MRLNLPAQRDDTAVLIVEAAAQLLSEQGSRALTTRGVAQRAGAQAPTIYRLFGDKDGLIDAVAEHVMATYVAAKRVMATRTSDTGAVTDPLDDLRAGWAMHVDFGLANPELYALISARGGPPSASTQAGIEVLRTRVRRLAQAGRLRVDEERALLMIHAAGNGAVLALLHQPPEARDLGLSEAMFEAVTASILSASPELPDTTMNTVAVTFATMIPDLLGLTEAERTLMAEWLSRALDEGRA